jgi:hypothetical protein
MPTMPPEPRAEDTADGAEQLRIVRRPLLVGSVAIFATLLVLHMLVMVAKYALGRRYLGGFANLLNVDEEESLSTILQMLNLMAAAALLFLIGRRARRLRAPHWLAWLALSAIFVYLAIDESTQVHEQLIIPLQRGLGTSGVLYFAWLVVAIPLVVLFVILYVPFLRDLDVPTRRLFLLSGFLYVCGTIGMELVGGAWVETHTFESAVYQMILVPIEEIFEYSGQTLFVWTLLGVLAAGQPRLDVTFER